MICIYPKFALYKLNVYVFGVTHLSLCQFQNQTEDHVAVVTNNAYSSGKGLSDPESSPENLENGELSTEQTPGINNSDKSSKIQLQVLQSAIADCIQSDRLYCCWQYPSLKGHCPLIGHSSSHHVNLNSFCLSPRYISI